MTAKQFYLRNPEYLKKATRQEMKVILEKKFGRIMYSNQIGLMFSWGRATIPNRRYISFEAPFLIIQIYI